jgi:hypothetical protein
LKIIDNINSLLGDDMKASIYPKAKLKIAASCFSIYAYEAFVSDAVKINVKQNFKQMSPGTEVKSI